MEQAVDERAFLDELEREEVFDGLAIDAFGP
jgi:hypothetical protein